MNFQSGNQIRAALVVAVAALLFTAASHAQTQQGVLALKAPVMGWNSWDSYGTTVDEAAIRANAAWMASHLKAFGWQYITVDMEWFVLNPEPEGNPLHAVYEMDAQGRFQPDLNRFPSARDGAGFKPLADYVHSLGLKFGIHILQGIPRTAVQKNLPIAGTSYTSQDAADSSKTCKWNHDNYDSKNNAAGQAYYNSIAALYAGWGVDLIKVDCIASDPFKGEEIKMLSAALGKAGRPVVLSLSPGPTPVEKQAEVEQLSTMWRISQDIWDVWHTDVEYPKGLDDQFVHAAQWASAPRDGHYPDADMLPLGYLGPKAGWGKARQTRLTHDEQRTLLNLWGISRSPLVMGGDLPHNDRWTTSLLTNREFLKVDQHSRDTRVAVSSDAEVVWTSRPETGSGYYIAVFNRSGAPRHLHFLWKDLGMPEGRYRLRDLWEHRSQGKQAALEVELGPHASALYLALPR